MGEKAKTVQASIGQTGLWSLDKMEHLETSYHTVFSAKIVSGYDTALLKRFFQEFLKRHRVCSSSFYMKEGALLLVPNESQLAFTVLDVRKKSRKEIRTLANQIYSEPFDLETGPLFKVHLLEISQSEAVLLVVVHHIITDGFSLSILIDELKKGYSSLVRTGECSLPPLKRSYFDYAKWQNEFLSSDEAGVQREYWHNKLAGDLPHHKLPADYTRNTGIIHKGDIHVFTLSEDCCAEITEFIRSNKITMFSFFISVYQVLLYKYSGQKDMIIGHPSSGRMRTGAGRRRSDYNDNFGYFVNPLLFRGSIDENESFAAFCMRNAATLKEDFRHQDYPFGELHKELKFRARDLAVPEVLINYQKQRKDHRDLSMFKFDLKAGKTVDLDELLIAPYYLPQQEGSSDLEWEILESEDQIHCNLKFRTDIFGSDTICEMETHIRAVIESVLSDSSQKVGNISLLSSAEQDRIYSFNKTERDVSSFADFTISRLFEKQVENTPYGIALDYQNSTITYDELNRRANQLAFYLKELGVGKETVAAIMLPRSPEMIIAVLAVEKAGGAFLPIDSNFPTARKRFMLEDAGASVCITSIDIDVPPIAACPAVRIDELDLELFSDGNPETDSVPENLAYIIYTSGSTGLPKGVMLEHTGFINMIIEHLRVLEITPDDVVLQFASLSFDASLFEIFLALFSGAKLVLADRGILSQPAALADFIEVKGISTTLLPPVMLKQLSPQKLRLVRNLITGGESPVNTDVEIYRKKRLYLNAYGPTEGSVIAAYYRVDPVKKVPGSIPIGKPIANTRIYIMDENRNLCPVGIQGEIYCAGIGVGRGYVNNPELTKEKFLADPLYPGGRMYRTGDLGRWLCDGNIEFCGRIDNQIKISGYRVELGEIEQQLMNCSEVSQASVIDCVNSQGIKYLAAFLVCENVASPGEIKAALSKSLPYYMVPSQFHFLDSFPVTNSGKIDRKKLLEIEGGSFCKNPLRSSKPLDCEKPLTEIWKSILGISSCDRKKNFFDLGGHSLQVVELQNRINREFGLELPVTDLFTFSTIESLSAHIEKSLTAPAESAKSALQKIECDNSGADIAIIGMAGRFPGAADIDQFWDNLIRGEESITTFSQKELLAAGVSAEMVENPNYIPVKGILEDVELLDASFFKFNPRDAELTDPQHRLFLETVHTAFEHAGYDYQALDISVGVFASTGYSSYLQQNIGSDLSMEDQEYHQMMIGNDKDFLATRVAYKFNFTGPAQSIQTACSSSLVNVHFACESLLSGSCDMAIAGGVSITFPMKSGYLYSPDGIASQNGQCRPFDSKAKGTVPGNGVAAVLLKRAADAVRDGDTVYAVIKGSAVNNDGAGKIGFTAPSVLGQKEVVRQALEKAAVPPHTVDYIEAHGTGTSLGDPIEFRALSEVYSENRSNSCAVGSVKSNIGHLDSASGVTGLIKAVLSLYHKMIVPTVHFEEPNSALQIEKTDMHIAKELSRWESSNVRRAAVSSLGLGGTNVHVVLEESLPVREKQLEKEFYLLPVSARTGDLLSCYKERVEQFLNTSEESLHDIAFTFAVGRQICAERAVTVVSGRSRKSSSWVSPKLQLETPQVVWLFPGQGSQYINMGRELYGHETVFRDSLDNILRLLQKEMDVDLLSIVFPVKEDEKDAEIKLAQTEITQPALFAISLALADLWKSWGVVPDKIIGHSFGEFAGAVTAGVMTLEDAVVLIAKRSELIQKAAPGSMLAVFAEESEIVDYLNESLSVAAYNSPRNCVISGPSKSINMLARELKSNSILSHELSVSHAFHSTMMKDAAVKFRATVEKISLAEPTIPIISTVTGKLVSGEMCDPQYWCRQITEPVRFSPAVAEAMDRDTVFLEVGSADTLCRLINAGRYERKFETVCSLSKGREKRSDVETVLNSLGVLWCHGVSLDLKALCSGGCRVAVPSMPLDKKRYWIEPSEELKRSRQPQRPNDPAEWIYAPTWIPSIPPNRNWQHDLERCSITWLIFLDKVGLGDELAAKLRSTGQKVITVRFSPDTVTDTSYYDSDSFVIHHHNKEEYDLFIQELIQRNSLPDRVIHLSLLTNDQYTEFEEKYLNEINYLGFFSLLFIVKALQNNHIDKIIEFTTITDHIFSVNGEDWINPLKAPVQGPITVIPQEHHSINMQHIDVSLARDPKEIHWLAEFLIQDIINFKPNMTLAYRNHRRWTRGFEQLKAEPGSVNIKKNGVYLITGGMGEVGLSIATDFAHTANATLILMGDTNLPERKNWKSIIRRNEEHDRKIIQKLQTIIEIEEIGCRVILATMDFSDKIQLDKILARIEEKTGRINGIIHATGTVGNSLISTRTIDNIEQIFSPKIQGTMNLGLFFKERDLDFFLLFSSLNAITGGIEQVAYSGANAFLDAVAAHNFSDRHLNTLSINWPGWKEERGKRGWNKDSYRKKYQEQYEANAISLKEGMSTLKLCLSFGPTYHLIVSPKEFNKWREKIMSKEMYDTNSVMTQRYERPPLATELAPATTSEELFLVDLWESIINIAPIGIDDNFFELGGHSLMGLEMLSRIAEEKKVSLQINDLYEYPTIRSFITLLNNHSLKDPFTEFNMEEHRESRSTLVTQLQKGTGENSLYLFQPLGVNVYYYQPLVKYLDPSLSVYAFRLSEVETDNELPQTINEIAENSVDILLRIESGENFHLAGASFGGVIAYEVAQSLLRRGKSINFLSLFDSPNPRRLPKMPESDAEILHYIFKQWAPLSLGKLQEKSSLEEQCEYIVDFVRESKQSNYDIKTAQVVQLLQLFRTGGKALKEYEPEFFDGTLLFLKPLTYHPDYDKSADKSWRKISSGFEIHNVPGDHLTMNQDPHVESIAAILNSRLCS